jgi:uncharacterized DUF497 family protein
MDAGEVGRSCRIAATKARVVGLPRGHVYVHYMDNVTRFEWDSSKDAANRLKHGVDFHEAASAFEDERGLVIADPEHSRGEDRFVLLGMSVRARLLVVVHCWRQSDRIIRIISARRASAEEARQYLRRR